MIPVSDNLKNAVINEEKPKTLTVSKLTNGLPIDYFNLSKNNDFAGRRVVYGDSAPSSNYVRLTLDNSYSSNSMEYYGLKDIDWTPIQEAGGYYIGLRFKMNSCELKRKSDGQWITTAKPTKARLYFSFKEADGYYSTAGFDVGVDNWWQIDWEDNAHGCLICAERPNRQIEYIYKVELEISFDDSLYDGLIFDVTVYDPIINALSSNDVISATKIYNQYDVEDFLDRSFTSIDNSHIMSESFGFEESICTADRLKLGGCESKKIEIQTFDDSNDYTNRNVKLSLGINSKGNFDFEQMIPKKIDKSSRGGTVCKRITAYDRLDRLSNNAYAWYTQYMFGMNLIRDTQYRNYHFDYERQIFSTYWNLAKTFGIEREGESVSLEYVTKWSGHFYNSNLKFDNSYFGKETASTYTMYCDDSELRKYNVGDYKGIMFKHIAFEMSQGRDWYKEDFDSIGRGAFELGSIMIELYDSNDNLLGNFLLDDGDILLLPQNWDKFKLIYTTAYNSTSAPTIAYLSEGLVLYGVNFNYYDPYSIVNATAPLPYYSYVWRKPSITNIFTADSSITARDVMRSLMEMCGCFYRLSRDGKPQFIYAQEHGLYPSNDLYPADTLFPKKSGEMTMPTSYYISAEFAEFQVEKFGGVQVVVRTKDNTGAVVRWEYWEDDSSDSAYLIDDNIFLCAEEFLYDPQNTGNIDTLLENIFHCLDNLQYTPFTAETIGTPFLESGDRFTLLTQTDGFESFIFDRKLKGIQALKDHYEARGIAKTPRINNFEWQS